MHSDHTAAMAGIRDWYTARAQRRRARDLQAHLYSSNHRTRTVRRRRLVFLPLVLCLSMLLE